VLLDPKQKTHLPAFLAVGDHNSQLVFSA
jgi:hypothetical protein